MFGGAVDRLMSSLKENQGLEQATKLPKLIIRDVVH